jgi:hypothetical protein
MKRYLLSIMQPDGEKPEPEVLERVMREVRALIDEARAAEALVFNGGLEPPKAASVVRFQGGEVLVSDGPYTEAKEHIGGLLILQAPDHDTALEWAGKAARAITLPIELRAFQPEEDRRSSR